MAENINEDRRLREARDQWAKEFKERVELVEFLMSFGEEEDIPTPIVFGDE